MRYLISRSSLLLGTMALLMVGILAYARRDAPDEWVVYAVKDTTATNSIWEFYRIRVDGQQQVKIGSLESNYPTGQAWMEDGWVTVRDRYDGWDAFQLLRLDGSTKTIVRGRFEGINVTPYRLKPDAALFQIYPIRRGDPPTLHLLDLQTYHLSPIELPIAYDETRVIRANRDRIVWSDHASAGDLYLVRHDNPAQLIPLTTSGDILRRWTRVNAPGWIYYYASNPTLSLYRMREDGSEEQLIAEDVLLLDYALDVHKEDALYYWAGDENDAHLVRANFDGSNPTILLNTLLYGWQVAELAGSPYVYYGAYPPNTSPEEAFFQQALHRLNLETGEDVELLDGRPYMQVEWTPNQQYLLIWMQRDDPFGTNYELLRIRPDGSDPTVLIDKVLPAFNPTMDQRLLILAPEGTPSNWLCTLDLETFEIRELQDNKQPNAIRSFLGTTRTPDAKSQAGWLAGFGLLCLVVGMGLTLFPHSARQSV